MGQSTISMFNDVSYAIEKQRTFTFLVSGWISNVAAWLDRWSKAIVLLDTKNHCSSYRKTHGIKIWSYNSVFFSKRKRFWSSMWSSMDKPVTSKSSLTPRHASSKLALCSRGGVGGGRHLVGNLLLVSGKHLLAMPCNARWHRAFVWKMVEDGWKKMSSLFKSRVHRQCWCGVIRE